MLRKKIKEKEEKRWDEKTKLTNNKTVNKVLNNCNLWLISVPLRFYFL